MSAGPRRYRIRPRLAALALATAVVAGGAALAGEIANFGEVEPGLYRGGRPSEENVAALRELGVRTILDLEGGLFVKETEAVRRERRWAAAAGIDFEHVPLSPLGAPKTTSVEAALAVLTDAARRPLFVHCHAGVDRTGFVVAAYRLTAEGWTAERAHEEMIQHGFHRLLFWWTEAFFRYAAEAVPEPDGFPVAGSLRAAYAGER